MLRQCDVRITLEVFYRTYILVWHIGWWPWEADGIGEYVVTHRGWGVEKLYVEFTTSCSSCTWIVLLGISALGDHTHSRSDHTWYICIWWSLPTWLSWPCLVNSHWGGHKWFCLVNPHWGTIRSLWPCMLRSDSTWLIRIFLRGDGEGGSLPTWLFSQGWLCLVNPLWGPTSCLVTQIDLA